MTEQLFAKDTKEYLQKNLYELTDLAADKLGRSVFFDSSLTVVEKTERALRYDTVPQLGHVQARVQDFNLMVIFSGVSSFWR